MRALKPWILLAPALACLGLFTYWPVVLVAVDSLFARRPGADGVFALEPPGFQVHVWQPGAGVISHTVAVGRFDGPYPFIEPPEDALELTAHAKQ